LNVYISGQIEAKVSDGETRIFSAGDMVVLEDTIGKGHISSVIGDKNVILAVIQLEN